MKIFKKILVILIMAIFMLSNISSYSFNVAYASSTEDDLIVPEIIPTQSISITTVTPGETAHISILVRLNTYLDNQSISIDSDDPHIEITSDITLTRQFSQPPIKLESNMETKLEFDVLVKDTAKKGNYNLTLKASGMDIFNNYHSEIKMKQPIVIKVPVEKSEPNLVISDLNIPEEVKAGEQFNVTFTLTNAGGLTAKDTSIMIDGFVADGIMPAYTKSRINQGDIKSSSFNSISVPLKVANEAMGGHKTLTVKITCKDSDKKDYLVDIPIYINVKGGSSLGDPNLLISDVTQSVSSPMAGSKVIISFNLVNKSSSDLKEIKITPTNLTNANFSPVKSEPYQYISNLKSGVKKKVNMNLLVSKDVVEGLNELDISYTYKDDAGKAFGPITSKLFVLNVQNSDDKGSTPKLIISDFKTSEESIKAGKTFDFGFDVLNTNSKVSAKNIKVTLSSTDNVFSVTKGSNSFYIPVIKAGETKHNTMNLKAKADSVTKAYPLEIKFEYEYEGMPVPEDGTISAGVSVSEIINLQVMENARPVVSNIMMGYGEIPIINTPTTLNFEFYNLGKSVLSNVTAKIESTDFTASSAMLFIGNIDAGTGDIQEIEITPMIEGLAKGNLIISYEDSNGDTIDVPTPFESAVDPMPAFNPGMEDPGMNPEIPLVKKEIMNMPVFVMIQIILFLIMIPIGRKVTLELYKKKLHKDDENSI